MRVICKVLGRSFLWCLSLPNESSLACDTSFDVFEIACALLRGAVVVLREDGGSRVAKERQVPLAK